MSDDISGLESYLGMFTSAGSVPTSLSGYGYGQTRHNYELAALGAIAPGSVGLKNKIPASLQPYFATKYAKNKDGSDKTVEKIVIQNGRQVAVKERVVERKGMGFSVELASDMQRYLNALKVDAGSSGRLDSKLEGAWNKYTKVFQEPNRVNIGGVLKSPIAPGEDPSLGKDYKYVWVNPEAFQRLRTFGMRASAAPVATPAKTSSTPAAKTQNKSSGNSVVSTAEVQRVLVTLGSAPEKLTDGKFGPTTKAAWEAVAKKKSLNPTIVGTKGAKQVTVDAVTLKTLQNAAASATPPATTAPVPTSGVITTSTVNVQDVLRRLGWKNKKIDDGVFGGATAAYWKDSATKQNVDPYISKASVDGKQVKVNERTYLTLKANADAKAPSALPVPIPASVTTTIAEAQLNGVLGRLAGRKTTDTAPWPKLVEIYQAFARDSGNDPLIQKDAKGAVVVAKSTWTALMSKYDKTAPVAEPVAIEQKTTVDAAVRDLLKQATAVTKTADIQTALNAAIQVGALKRSPFTSSTWVPGFVEPLIRMSGLTDAVWSKAWNTVFVPGKLVSKDLKTVKLLPNTSAAIKKQAGDYRLQQLSGSLTFAGYTKINSASIIDNINSLNISATMFNASGGATELAEAVETFIKNLKLSVSGDTVKVDPKSKDVYLKTDILNALAKAVTAQKTRETATQSHRDKMVANALKESSGTISVDDLQQAFIETVRSGAAGSDKKLFSAVKPTGAFDTATRAAYTSLARRATIGPAFDQFQKLLKAQLGARFKSALAEEVYNKVWSDFLAQAVVKNGSKLSLKALPSIAKNVANTALVYRSQEKTGAVEQAKIAELQKVLADAVAKSNVIVSILDVQQALSQMLADGSIRKLTTWDNRPAGSIKLTGRTDGPTREGLFWFSKTIFPAGFSIPDTLWGQYLNEVGIGVVSAADVRKGWASANYIALPQAVADTISKAAGEWIASKGVAAASKDLVPVPLANQELRLRFTKPTVITAKRPQGDVAFDVAAERAAAAAKKKADDARLKAEAARQLAEEARQRAAADAANQATQEATRQAEAQANAAEAQSQQARAQFIAADAQANIEEPALPSPSASGAGGAGGGGGQITTGDTNITMQLPPAGGSIFVDDDAGATPAPAPGPTPPPEPTPGLVQASMLPGWLLMSAAGLGVLLFLPKKDKDKGKDKKKLRGYKPLRQIRAK
jgi:hypothetical protein